MAPGTTRTSPPAPPSLRWTPAFLGLALGALALGGCAADELVCDDEGRCYQCDGLGCRPADPPANPPCLVNDDCDDGAICTVSGCVPVCVDDADCGPGRVCRDAGDGRRLCVPEDEPAPLCVRNEDCNASGVECRDGLCVPSDLCEADADCGAGEACVGGRCEVLDDLCRFSRECASPRECVDGECVLPCSGDGDCGAGEVCDEALGFCAPAPPPPPGSCTRDGDCGAGEVCLDSRCVDGCADDGDCGAGQVCNARGLCERDTAPVAFCAGDSDCSAGSRCVDGLCRRPCDDDLSCRRFDSQLPFCVEGFCATSNEATSDCALSSDCPAGEACVDGVCRR